MHLGTWKIFVLKKKFLKNSLKANYLRENIFQGPRCMVQTTFGPNYGNKGAVFTEKIQLGPNSRPKESDSYVTILKPNLKISAKLSFFVKLVAENV